MTKRKVAWWFIGIYVAYILLMLWYFFILVEPGVPLEYRGTAADPNLFMSHGEILSSQEYSRIQNLIYFLTIPLDWGIYFFVLVFGFSRWLKRRSQEVTKFSVIHTAIYFLTLSILTWVIAFPISFLAHEISISYGVSVQSFGHWMRDNIVSFWLNWIITFITVLVIYLFIRRKPKRWWLPVWLLSIPFTILMVYIQPVVIDPLYNDFHSLEEGELKQEILSMADKAGIPADNVYEVDMSDQTNGMNAYVNGIGSNLRIVLWDTTVNRLSDDEVLFIMAHEMGHYVKNHLLWSVVGSIFISLIGLYLAARLLYWATNRWGVKFGFRHPGDIASLPLLLLIISLLSFAGSPVENAVSRHYEHAADVYAIKLTDDEEAGIHAFQKLTSASLGDVNPPRLVQFLLYGHPTMLERIHFLEEKLEEEHNSQEE